MDKKNKKKIKQSQSKKKTLEQSGVFLHYPQPTKLEQ